MTTRIVYGLVRLRSVIDIAKNGSQSPSSVNYSTKAFKSERMKFHELERTEKSGKNGISVCGVGVDYFL